MFASWNLEDWKTLAELAFYVVGIVAAYFAVQTYRDNAKLEQSRWLSTLYQRFYEQEALKPVRDVLDDAIDADGIKFEVQNETTRFTDYLNFFEYLAYLVESGRIGARDAEAMFGYYLSCLKRHTVVQEYIRRPEKGFEKLHQLLWPNP